MTHLKKLMLEELERRNSPPAQRELISGPSTSIRATPTALRTDSGRITSASTRRIWFRERKLQPSTVIPHLGGIRFFYIRTLKQSWSTDLTPYPKKVIHLPSILSREQVNSLIEAAPTPFQRLCSWPTMPQASGAPNAPG